MTPAEANEEASKLDDLAWEWGMTVPQFLDAYALDEAVPGICMNPDCLYTTRVQPEEREGWCEACCTRSVRSGIVLAGIP